MPDPVASVIGGLTNAVNGCADSPSASSLTLQLSSDPAVISAPNGQLTVNGYACTSTIQGKTLPMTTTTTSKIAIQGTASTDKVILDLLPGSFGSKIFSSTGGISIDFASDPGGADEVMLRGSPAPETFKFVSSTAMTETYIELSGDRTADVMIKPASGVALTASMGSGADTVLGNDVNVTGFAGVNNISVQPLATSLIALGGSGADVFTGGDGDDTFYGGDDDDTFKSAVGDDGSDTYEGQAGSDTVDYSNRTQSVSADVGPLTPTVFGTVNLGATPTLFGSQSTLGSDYIFVDTDLGSARTWFTTPVAPADLVKSINDACASNCRASLTGQNKLAIATPTLSAMGGWVQMRSSTAQGRLGLPLQKIVDESDADDGLSGEFDDILTTTENITGGSGDDILAGDAGRNVLKGGPGQDILEGGGSNPTSCGNVTALQADSLQGEAGDDTLYVPLTDCSALLSGGMGNDTVDYSGRHRTMTLSLDGVANDGDAVSGEKASIASDIERVVGGYGDDVISGGTLADTLLGGAGDDLLSGGAGDDILIGGAGADTFNGGLGSDSVDYSSYGPSEPVHVSLCVTIESTVSAIDSACGSRDDGFNESDQIANVERVLGGDGDDVMQAATSAAVDTTFEGGAGQDDLRGAGGNDVLWGDAGNDHLSGGAGDDSLDGGNGVDQLNGGAGDGDICVLDPNDSAASACEL